MEIRFDNRAGRWLFLFAILLASATLAFLGGKNALADFYGESSRADDWSRAARLEPGNADAWYRLARYRELDFERSEEHTSELQSQSNLVCRLLLEKKKKNNSPHMVDRRQDQH